MTSRSVRFTTALAATAILAASTPVSAIPRPATQCVGCIAGGGGIDEDICPGTGEYVRVTIYATDGECKPVVDDPVACQPSPCFFKVDFEWRLPSGLPVNVCHTVNTLTYCLNPPPQASGGDEQIEYDFSAGCNGTAHRFSLSGSTACGPILAARTVSCSECSD